MPRIAFLHARSGRGLNDNHVRLPRAFHAAGWRVELVPHESIGLARGRVVGETSDGGAVELAAFDAFFVLGFGPRQSFLDRMQLLRGLDQRRFVNTVDALIHHHGKVSLPLACPDVPQPASFFGNDPAALAALVAEGGEWIAKPPAGSFGRDVFRLCRRDPNLRTVLEYLTRDGGYALLQERVTRASADEKRVLIAGGEIVAAYGKRPADHRGNLDAGATARPTRLTTNESAILQRLATRLLALGVRFAAVDVAGALVLEVNIANPGGLATCEVVTGEDPTPRATVAIARCLEVGAAAAPSAGPAPVRLERT